VKFEAPTTTSVFDTGDEVPDHDHTQERRELIIYAIPLTRGKVGARRGGGCIRKKSIMPILV
jgi:hypothetical protein